VLDRLDRAVWIFGTICMVILFALTTAQVILRYGFGFSPNITEEGGRTMLVWSVLAGSAIAVRHKLHIQVDFLNLALPKPIQRVLNIVLDMVVLFLFCVVTVTGIDATLFAHGQVSTGLMLPLSYFYFVVPLFFAVSAIFMAELLYKEIKGGKSGGDR
jgi:TRAP-type C4-dicarboxylate transport system permease small subunit